MAIARSYFLAMLLLTALVGTAAAQAPETIRIGDLSSYSAYPAFTEPYRNGWRLGFEQINAAGGILKKGVEVISRDDGGTAATAAQAATTLLSTDKVSLLFGTFLSDPALAVSEVAGQQKALFIATLPLADDLTLARGNRYTFRPLRASTYMQTAMLVDAARSIEAKRWAIIAPNYSLGLSAAETFRSLMAETRSNAEIVAEHYAPLGRVDAAAAVSSFAGKKPDAVFCALFGADLAAFSREANRQGALDGVAMFSLFAGEPEWLSFLGTDVPVGAIATGYDSEAAPSPEHQAFISAYRAKFAVAPSAGALIGYMSAYFIKDLIEQAGALDTEALVKTAANMSTQTINGSLSIRSSDHQGTMGTFLGKLAIVDGKPAFVDARFVDGAEFLPPEEIVETLRP